jgi:hypothetical protein
VLAGIDGVLLVVVIGDGKLVVPWILPSGGQTPRVLGGRAGTNYVECRACWTGAWRPCVGAA